jgi:hypothetical protein
MHSSVRIIVLLQYQVDGKKWEREGIPTGKRWLCRLGSMELVARNRRSQSSATMQKSKGDGNESRSEGAISVGAQTQMELETNQEVNEQSGARTVVSNAPYFSWEPIVY